MAKSVHHIAVTMSADMSKATRQFQMVGKEINRLEAIQTKLAKENKFNPAIDRQIAKLKAFQNETVGAKTKVGGFFKELNNTAFAAESTSKKLFTVATALRHMRTQIVKNEAAGRMHNNGLRRQIILLQQQEKQLMKTARAEAALNRQKRFLAGGAGRLQQAFGQASFAVEDFMSVVGTMGVSGGLRAAGNNLSMMGHILGGPKKGALYGGIVGVAAIALPMLWKAFSKTSEEAEKAKLSLDDWLASVRNQQALEDIALEIKFKMEDLQELEELDSVTSFLKQNNRELEKMELALKKLQETNKHVLTPILSKLNVPTDALEKFLGTKHLDELNQRLDAFIVRIGKVPGDIEGAAQIAINAINKIFDEQIEIDAPVIAEEKANQSGISTTERQINSARKLALDLIQKTTKNKDIIKEIADLVKESDQSELEMRKKINALHEAEREAKKKEQQALEQRSKGVLDKLKRMGQDADEKVLQGIRDEIDKINKLLSEVKPEDADAALDMAGAAAEKLIQDEIDAIKGDKDKDKDTDPLPKGLSVLGDNMNEQVAQVRNMADAQIQAAAREKEDVKREKLLEKLEEMLEDQRANRTVAHLVGV